MKEFWNQRFSQEEYVYGTEPNEYLKEKLSLLPGGDILLPAEGEGRNAVFAAKTGWKVTAFDQSSEGKKKALLLADKHNVSIDYRVHDVEDAEFASESFDVVALIYTHFPESNRHSYHRKLCSYIKKGGMLILEGFSKAHVAFQAVNPKAGGPVDVSLLYDVEALRQDFDEIDIQEACQTETILHEGENHKGRASVVRITGIKK